MEKVNNSDSGDSKKLIVGDDSSQVAISFKHAQAFYNEISGRSEKIYEEYSKSTILNFNDIKQLDLRVRQTISQYKVEACVETFAVKYKDNSSERFSSFARFELHSEVKNTPVEEVNIQYNLLFLLPELQEAQEYKINVRLCSRTVKLEKIQENLLSESFSIPLWQFDKGWTCEVSIDFIDINVAYSLMTCIKNWYDSIKTVDTTKALIYVRKISKFFPIFFKYALLIVGVFLTMSSIESYFNSLNTYSTAKFIILAFIFNFILFNLGNFVGLKSKKHIDKLYDISYIHFTEADVKFARECSLTRKWNVIKSLSYFGGAILLGLIATVLENYIFG